MIAVALKEEYVNYCPRFIQPCSNSTVIDAETKEDITYMFTVTENNETDIKSCS
jgi:hypothetical protein